MKTRSRHGYAVSRGLLPLAVLLLAGLACQTVTGAFQQPSPLPTATYTAIPPAVTASPPETQGPTPDFSAAGVRYCYYVPGVSVPEQMPPDVLATPTPYMLPTPAIPAQTAVDAATTQKQLDLFQQLWQDVNNNYVYTDFNGHDWQAIGDKYKALIKAGLSQQDFYRAMEDMIYELGDEHSSFLDPAQVKAANDAMAGNQNFVGIGALVNLLEDGKSGTIVAVFPNSPAAEAGLRLHDKVLGVDGGPWLDATTGESRTLGPAGTQVTVTIQRPGEDPHDYTLTRRAISGPMPIDYCLVRDTRIGYIYLPTFFDETIADQVKTALEKMTSDGPLDGLIIDNRTNSGGLNSVGAKVLGYFTDGLNGHFVSRKESRPLEIQAEDINGSQTVPLVVMVDLGTASYGEIFSGILRVANRAKIVGQNTLGNVETVTPFTFDDGSQAWIASLTFEPIGEANGIWERTGIIPDVYAPTRWDLFTEATDPALAKAIDLLMQK